MSYIEFDPELEKELLKMTQAGRIADIIREKGEAEVSSERFAKRFFGKIQGLVIKPIYHKDGGETFLIYSVYQS